MTKLVKFVPYFFIILLFGCFLTLGYLFLWPNNIDEYNNESNIYFNCENLSIKVGESIKLDAGFLSTVESGRIEWLSSNTDVLIVNDGTVQGLMPGEVNVTANFSNYNISRDCKISVIDNGNMNTDTNIDTNTGTNTGSNVDINTESNTGSNLDTNIDSNTNTGSGSNMGSNLDTNTNTNVVVKVSSVGLNSYSITMGLNEKNTLVATVLPSNASNKNVVWSSSNTNVATVYNGVVTAVGIGKATITVETVDGNKRAMAEVVVKSNEIGVSQVSLNASTIKLSKGNKKTLKATISPSNATNKTITWSSSNSAVATVSDGVVTATGNGTAVISAKSSNEIIANCTVIVGTPTLKISNSSVTIIDGNTRKLTATLSYSALDQSVTWSSSDTKVATVDSNGNVKAKSTGTAVITAKSNYDSSITVECKVTVRAARVLYIGNSKTYFPGSVNEDNGIPKRFKAIAKNAGYEIEYTQAVIGGVALNTILADEASIKKIKKSYDYVIINQGTDRSYSNKTGYYDDINTIKTWAEEKNSNVKIYIRKIWLRIRKDSNGSPEGGNTETQIQKSYSNAEYVANKLGVNTINDGPMFYDMIDNKSSIHIMKYQDGDTTDLTHQNSNGAYLAALCFYAEVYDKDPTQITYNAGISESTANTLKKYAKKHCYNN